MDFSLRDFSRDSFWTGHAQQSIFFPNMRSPWLLWRNFYPWSKHYACKKEKLVMSSSRFAFLVSSFFEAPPNLPFPKKKAPKTPFSSTPWQPAPPKPPLPGCVCAVSFKMNVSPGGVTSREQNRGQGCKDPKTFGTLSDWTPPGGLDVLPTKAERAIIRKIRRDFDS